MNAANSRIMGQRGFGLIDVWAALLIVTMAILAITALQGRAFQTLHEAKLHGQAVHLAQQMAETIRLYRRTSALFVKTDGSPAPTADCPSVPSSPAHHMACWFEDIRQNMPVDNELLSLHTHICHSLSPGQCGGGSIIEIQLGWYSRNGICPEVSDSQSVCHYQLRFIP